MYFSHCRIIVFMESRILLNQKLVGHTTQFLATISNSRRHLVFQLNADGFTAPDVKTPSHAIEAAPARISLANLIINSSVRALASALASASALAFASAAALVESRMISG